MSNLSARLVPRMLTLEQGLKRVNISESQLSDSFWIRLGTFCAILVSSKWRERERESEWKWQKERMEKRKRENEKEREREWKRERERERERKKREERNNYSEYHQALTVKRLSSFEINITNQDQTWLRLFSFHHVLIGKGMYPAIFPSDMSKL